MRLNPSLKLPVVVVVVAFGHSNALFDLEQDLEY
jgi:hypothetical protein